jgi:16S rRNA C1402 (ribose-2'-O) methylase RsmI
VQAVEAVVRLVVVEELPELVEQVAVEPVAIIITLLTEPLIQAEVVVVLATTLMQENPAVQELLSSNILITTPSQVALV